MVITLLTITQDNTKKGTEKPINKGFSGIEKGSRQLMSKAYEMEQGKRDSNPHERFWRP